MKSIIDTLIAENEIKAELNAAEQYRLDLRNAQNYELRKILKHNREDEIDDHAKNLRKWKRARA